jgi:hypothetical protein
VSRGAAGRFRFGPAGTHAGTSRGGKSGRIHKNPHPAPPHTLHPPDYLLSLGPLLNTNLPRVWRHVPGTELCEPLRTTISHGHARCVVTPALTASLLTHPSNNHSIHH